MRLTEEMNWEIQMILQYSKTKGTSAPYIHKAGNITIITNRTVWTTAMFFLEVDRPWSAFIHFDSMERVALQKSLAINNDDRIFPVISKQKSLQYIQNQ